MATKKGNPKPFDSQPAHTVAWDGLGVGDDGSPCDLPGERSIQVVGEFGDGGALLVEGSNDGKHWDTLCNPLGLRLVITSEKIEQISGVVRLLRPRVLGGDAKTSLKAILLVRRS